MLIFRELDTVGVGSRFLNLSEEDIIYKIFNWEEVEEDEDVEPEMEIEYNEPIKELKVFYDNEIFVRSHKEKVKFSGINKRDFDVIVKDFVVDVEVEKTFGRAIVYFGDDIPYIEDYPIIGGFENADFPLTDDIECVDINTRYPGNYLYMFLLCVPKTDYSEYCLLGPMDYQYRIYFLYTKQEIELPKRLYYHKLLAAYRISEEELMDNRGKIVGEAHFQSLGLVNNSYYQHEYIYLPLEFRNISNIIHNTMVLPEYYNFEFSSFPKNRKYYNIVSGMFAYPSEYFGKDFLLNRINYSFDRNRYNYLYNKNIPINAFFTTENFLNEAVENVYIIVYKEYDDKRISFRRITVGPGEGYVLNNNERIVENQFTINQDTTYDYTTYLILYNEYDTISLSLNFNNDNEIFINKNYYFDLV